MDPLFIGGLITIFASIALSTIMDGNSFGPLIGPSSFVLVFFGALGAGLMAYRTAEIGKIPKAAIYSFKGKPPDPSDSVTTLAEFAQVARRDGMLALESKLEEVDDGFLRGGLQYLVDGLDADRVRELLEIGITAIDERHQTPIGFFKAVAGYAPTFGMVGTVIGLINMLGNLSDPEQLGAGMALALLTTLYGVLFANVLFGPIASRLERLNQLELGAREVVLDGILSIQAGMSPRLVVERLETYLPPEARLGHSERIGKKPGAAAA
ncbi:MAG TPA: motility protein A [Euzebyales bacterium]|nr:motility protein A [Euzebyales bacterium]